MEEGKIQTLKNYQIHLSVEQVLTRLGYNKYKTQIDEKTKKLITQLMNEAQIFIEPRGRFSLTKIQKKNDNTILFLEIDYLLESKSLTKHIKNSDSIILLSGTIGEQIIKEIESYFQKGENEKGVILDAIASELAENNIEYIEKVAINRYKKIGQKIDFRFSPGYGDLKLNEQIIFEKILKISELGILINENYILIPEKSITAFIPFHTK
ncbi:MAG TPA: hypothetical protein PLD27_00020 [bacterium]|nr:hypothetical protein [bacterium]HOL47146.1 hypothetical protein [bacterium]HPQ18069.1 hypothetical protein [bacterium]